MGAYTIILDVALGFGGPGLGLIASWAGLGSVFFATTFIALGGHRHSTTDVRSAVEAERTRSTRRVYGCFGCSAQCGRCARTIRRIMDEALGSARAASCGGCARSSQP
jgi:bacterioferritin-associated ferredoxin